MKSVSFIGGDKRNYLVSKIMEKSYKVFSYGFKNSENELGECIEGSSVIILPIPLSKDGIHLYMPENATKIDVKDVIKLLKNKMIFAGGISNEHRLMLEKCGNTVIDVTKDSLFVRKNAIPTAEGIIAKIIENTKWTLAGSKILVLGFGNVGKAISNRAHALGATVFAYDINQQEVANIRLSGYNVLEEIDKKIGDMDVIVNTVPEMILDEKKFEGVRKDTFIIDVASIPGGIDFEFAKTHGYNVAYELGIPGKIAPISAAEYVKEVIEKYIN